MCEIRNSGRTQFTIDTIVNCVKDGQPLCRVVAHSIQYAKISIMPRLKNALNDNGIHNTVKLGRLLIEANNTIITFHSKNRIKDDMRGMEHYDCQFWDHHAC